MKTFKLKIKTAKRNEIIDITKEVEKIIKEKNISEGIAIIYVPHTTAAVTINENSDPDVKEDILNQLSKIIPKNEKFKHGEGNSDAHIKSILVGNSVTVIIEEKKLSLGTWQAIYFCEFDGPRTREITLKVLESQ